jgi:hypothetical protein
MRGAWCYENTALFRKLLGLLPGPQAVEKPP